MKTKPTCTICWTGLAWDRAVSSILANDPKPDLDSAIRAAHKAGLVITAVNTTTGSAREAKGEKVA